jgi:transcriptional regulator with XRE-family HTH domain
MSEGEAYEDADKRLGNNLRRLRDEADMTQAELAQAMIERGWQWHQSTVARVESGRQSVRFSEAEALAKILGIALDRLTWAGPEGPEAAAIDQAGRRLRRAFERTSGAIRMHALELDHAQWMLARHRNSPYGRVRDACEELQEAIKTYTFDKAVDDGFERYDKDRDRNKRQPDLFTTEDEE